jgi:hypothetical protein
MNAQAARRDHRRAQPRFGTVSSFDPASFTARVTIQPEGVVSGWLPVLVPWVGAGWGMAAPPCPGEQVLVLWQEGDAEHGVIVGRAWSDRMPPPGAPAGELWLVHKSGSCLKLHNDGTIESVGAWHHSGDLHVSGDVFDAHGAVSQLRGHYNAHVHPPSASAPSPQD